jgi:tetratricopeptide (TPR) repeat protein
MRKLTLQGIAAIACLSFWLTPALADDGAAASPSSPQASQPSASLATPAITGHEQQWLVNCIGTDIAEMILFAAKNNGAEDVALDKVSCTTTEKSAVAGSYSYELKTNEKTEPETCDLHLSDYFWCPSNFSPWADQLIKKYKLTPTTHDDQASTELIKTLSNYNSPTIAKAEKDIAKELTKDPMNAALHEQAALLIATQSLRECASCFTDMRSLLDRVCAHLAVARALRGEAPYSDAGKLAEMTLLSLSGRTSEALPSLKSMQSAGTDQPTLSWLRGLEMRITMDPRVSKNESMMERLEYGRAVGDTIGSDKLTDYLQNNKDISRQIDWMRIGVRGIASVEAGHLYAEPGVRAEMQDFINNYGLFHDTNKILDPDSELNKQPTGCLVRGADGWELQPLSWPDLAAFHCRHILDAVFQAENFERHMWGVPQYADESTKNAERTFSKLTLYPLLKSCLVSDVIDEKTNKYIRTDGMTTAAVSELVKQHPEIVNSDLWLQSRMNSSIPEAIPVPDNWFVPHFLYGTAFDFYGRCLDADTVTLDTLERLKKLSPYNMDLINALAYKKYGANKANADQLKELYGPLFDYDLRALGMVVDAYEKTNPTLEAQLMEKVAALNPDRYALLGFLYLQLHQTDKAVAAFEKGVELERDDVLFSNSCEWLVRYYDEHGQRAKALALAQKVAEVYSATGLDTLALEYERMGKLSDAEATFKKVNERYPTDFESLCAFYVRNEKHDARYKQEATRLLSKAFPNGLKHVTLQDFKQAPTSGVEIKPWSKYLNFYNMASGNVIVALSGNRVDNFTQWAQLREIIANSDFMDLIVWDGKTFRAVKTFNPRPHSGWQTQTYNSHDKAAK